MVVDDTGTLFEMPRRRRAAVRLDKEFPVPVVASSELQAVLANGRRAVDALRTAGEAVPDAAALDAITTVEELERLLDPFVLAEAVVASHGFASVRQPHSPAPLIQAGWRSFLLRYENPERSESPFIFYGGGSMAPFVGGAIGRIFPLDRTEYAPWIRDDWWVEIRQTDTGPHTGLPVEYRVVHVYSRDAGPKAVTASFSPIDSDLKMPRGNSDEQMQRYSLQNRYAKSLRLEFDAAPARDVVFDIRDVDGRSCVAAVTVKDDDGRVYPARALRLAPDMYFHDHVYRSAGEPIPLPDGAYAVTATRGPEYLPVSTTIEVGEQSADVELRLRRWVDPAARGYYSGDPHIHGGGCSHYNMPTEGVTPETMIRHARGEGLWVSSVLTWGPCYYYQKQFFTGESISPPATLEHPAHQEAQGITWEPQATDLDGESVLHYDVEISGFPSSHSGHVILLGLTDQDYPGTQILEDWPSWNRPIHEWARAQGALTGYAHCGNGMGSPSTPTYYQLPNYEIPPFESNGSNEFLVDVALGIADFIAGAEVPVAYEANVWYHLLNTGYRPLMIGETDYPCMFDDRPGVGRTYVQLDAPPTGSGAMRSWIAGLRENPSYFGDGRSHIFDLALDGDTSRDRHLDAPGAVTVTATVAALLPAERPAPRVEGFSYDDPAFGWDLEWGRLAGTRRVPVELVANGVAVATQEIVADGSDQDVSFEIDLDESSWLALRILPSVHTQPIFVEIAGAPVRASRRSAEWLRDCVDKLWDVKHEFIRESERTDARAAYDEARAAFVTRAAEATAD
jgi:hypothetical protein